MKQQKLVDFVGGLGFVAKDRGIIVVKRTPEGIPQEVIEFFTKTDRYSALFLCENEMVIVSLSEVFGIKRDSYRVIAYDDLRGVETSVADGGMTRRIVLKLDDELLAFNAQHEMTSAIRTSSLWGAWHAENLPHTIEMLQSIDASA